ncbi:unnamed protein product, partial [Mesorhabditis spiculigera]
MVGKKAPVFLVSPDRFIDFTTVIDGKLTAHFEIFNISKSRIAFRVQSNSRGDYFVQPDGDFVEPGDRAMVHIMVQSDGNVDHRHRFLVHAHTVSEHELVLTKAEFWEHHPNVVSETVTLEVRAPEFNNAKLRERLLTQVAALRKTNSELQEKNTRLEEKNILLSAVLEDLSQQNGYQMDTMRFGYAMLALLLTAFIWDMWMTIIFTDDSTPVLERAADELMSAGAKIVEAVQPPESRGD